MKQFFAKTRVLLVALVLGGLMMISSEASAQTNGSLIAPPQPNKNWVSPAQAGQSIQAEITALTQQLNVLIQQQAPDAQIKEVKYLLQFYMFIQDGLNSGMHISQALLMAKSNFLQEDSTLDISAKKKEKVIEWYNEAVALLSV
ncbi:MAG: hypothetical protein K9I85_11440 [Saprospiraceae bacterium]|nr:hypothetical protein [Saprospiraceae bacterium]